MKIMNSAAVWGLGVLAVATTLASCGNPQVSIDNSSDPTAKAMAWADNDNPSIFSEHLKYKLTQLPRNGAAAVAPWTGNYWPTYQDNINYRWDGASSQSPAEKYAEAFQVNYLEGKISRYYGIESNKDRKACSNNSDCDKSIAEKCAKRRGEDRGRCIPTWWGICHAWAPAAILAPEPKEPVTRNGVTFKVQDIKALLTLAYDDVETLYISGRCDNDDSAGRIEYDANGRPANEECIDTNPGTLHLLLANLLGIEKRSFIEDRTFDDEVWNQPLRAFRVKSMKSVTAKQANELIGVREGGSGDSQTGLVAKGEWKHYGPYDVAGGDSVAVHTTGTGDADLFVRFGSQPTTRSYDCRPYLEGSDEECDLKAPAGAETFYVSLKGYGDIASSYHLSIRVGGTVPTKYAFNRKAKKFYEVRTEVDYIGESPASVDGYLGAVIDTYTHTDTYEYILELDGRGRIIGGEWLRESKRAHPDFLWLPTGRGPSAIARGAIRYRDIEELLQASLGTGGGNAVLVSESGNVAPREWKHYGPYEASLGEFVATLSGGRGDADLYVRKGGRPTTASYDCRPYEDGNEEVCRLSGPGVFYVSVKGYEDSRYDLSVRYIGEGEAPDSTVKLHQSATVSKKKWKRFTIAVQAGDSLEVKTESVKNVDLYLRMDVKPSFYTHDLAATSSSGNEVLTFTAPSDGVLHIGVRGLEKADFSVRASTL